MRTLVALVAAPALVAAQCLYPPPASSFANYTYSGTWYEIAKIQTIGGAIFEHDCVCTELVVSSTSPTSNPTDRTVLNSCRDKTPQGAYINATGYLVNQRSPGAWEETFIPGFPATVNYTVIALGEGYSIEYDCGESLFGTNYCIHILSSTPTMPASQLSSLVDYALSLGLNNQNLNLTITQQDGCW